MGLKCSPFLNHRIFAGIENRPIGRSQRKLLHFLNQRQRSPDNTFVLRVHFNRHSGAHITSLLRGE